MSFSAFFVCAIMSSGIQKPATANWQRVVELEPGRRISVQLEGAQSIAAVMVSADDLTLAVQRADNHQRERYFRADVIEVATIPNGKARNAAIGVSIIGAASIFIGGLGKNPEAGPSGGYWIGMPMLVGGLVALHEQPKDPVVIYRRPK
jgi:hypothetical protein